MAEDMDDIEDLLEAPYKNLPNDSHKDTETNGDSEHPAGSENGDYSNGFDKGTSGDVSYNNNDKNSNLESSSNREDATNGVKDHKHDDSKKENGDKIESSSKSDKEKNSKSDDSKSKDSKKSRKDRSRSRSRDRDRSRHRKRSRSSSRSKKSSKRSSRSRDRSEKEKSKDRDRKKSRDKSRSRSRDRARDKDRKRSRTKTRSRSRRRRSRSRDDSRSRRHRNSSRSRRTRSRTRSRTPVKRREKSPELTPEERDQRTVFCMQLSARIRPRDLEDFFTPVGKVRDVRLITDPRTKRSKGIAYIEFRETESVPLAIALTGQRLLGVPIIVKLTQAEKNRMPFTGPHIPANLPQTGPIKLYVGSLHVNINEDMLKGIFEPFGAIDVIAIARDDFGRSKGYGFIQFSSAEDGKKAMEQLNNFELAGRPIKVSLFISDNKAFDPIQPTIANLDNDDLDRTGVNLGPSGKLALMAKLAEGTGLKLPQQTLEALNMSANAAAGVPPVGSLVAQNGSMLVPNPVPIPPAVVNPLLAAITSSPTQCFLLSNMFDLEVESAKPNWVEEIRDDVIEECSKYGGIVHINIDQKAPEGNIYIKCPSISVAMAAMNSLNGRYFAGKLIKASYLQLTAYHQQFQEAATSTHILKPSF